MPRLGSLIALLGSAPAFARIHTTSVLGRAVGGQRRLQSSPDKSYERLGCFSDQGWDKDEDRALDNGFQSSEMTIEICAQECIHKGFHFMGLQNADECWCGSWGDEEKHTQYGEGTCNTPCSGDSSTTCGGFWAFELYFVGDMAATPTPELLASQQQVVVDMHNEARCVHGAEPMTWSSDVEETAKARAEYLTTAENCGLLTNSDMEERGYGENLFLCWGEPECMFKPGVLESIYGQTVTDPTGSVTDYDIHALRMLWKSTDQLGCSIGSCVLDTVDVEVMVCNYSPTGDYYDPDAVEREVENPSKKRKECIQTSTTGTPSPTTLELTPAPVTPATQKTIPPPVSSEPEPQAPEVGACDSSPCLNGGSCDLDTAGLYTCSCASGYAGMTCETDTSSYPEFFITVDFQGEWTDARKGVFESAANRWGEVLTHIPCSGTNPNGGAAGELRISATLESIDGPSGTLGFAGPSGIWSECRGIPYAGAMTFDIDDIVGIESAGTFEGVILHEMGHVIGTGTLWGKCSECASTGSAEWTCPLAKEVFNALEGNSPDARADIVELEGSQGTRCGHFSEGMFEDELMTGFVNAGTMPLSKLTVASLADCGYAVNMAMCDGYIVPNKRSMSAKAEHNPPIEINDERLSDYSIVVSDDEGHVVEKLESHRFRF